MDSVTFTLEKQMEKIKRFMREEFYEKQYQERISFSALNVLHNTGKGIEMLIVSSSQHC